MKTTSFTVPRNLERTEDLGWEGESTLGTRLKMREGSRPFPSCPKLCFKAGQSAKPLIWKRFFILMRMKLIFTTKVLHVTSFWKWEFLDLGNGLYRSKLNLLGNRLSQLVCWLTYGRTDLQIVISCQQQRISTLAYQVAGRGMMTRTCPLVMHRLMMRTMNRWPDQAQGLLLRHNRGPPLWNSRHKARIGNRPKRKNQVGEVAFLFRSVAVEGFFVHL